MRLEVDVEKRFTDFSCHLAFSLSDPRYGIYGPSGSGKSTLMNLLAGLMRPDHGKIILNGVTLFDSAAGINLPPEKRRIGVVFQHAHLFPHLTVGKNLFYGMKRIPAAERCIDPERLIGSLHLQHLLERRVTGLSGGERQRVALGRTMLACPHLILLDEPLTGLDGALKYQIIPYLRQVFEQFSLPTLFISHSLQEMRLMAERVLVIGNGRIEREIETETLARSSRIAGEQEYANLLELDQPEDRDDLLHYRWGELTLTLVKTCQVPTTGLFSLNARDIVLFKKHPEASSARNILSCTVHSLKRSDWLVAVELRCGDKTLIAEIVPQSVDELAIRPGSMVIAVFKASAVRKLS
jgi:molybdate transport system ATP-binding protein